MASRRRVLITGGSRGLGLTLCRRLVAEGWDVSAAARRSTPELEALATERSGALQFHAVDLAASGGVASLCRDARVLDGVDAFIANAAIGTEGLLTLTSESDIRACVELNLTSVMLLAREVIKGMLARGRGGSLVFISSIAARTGLSGLSVYSATKGGLLAFSRALSREYGARGIRSNCVLPGFLETEMSATLSEEARERLKRRTPLHRLGQAEDVAGLVFFLLSDDARHITGGEYVVDGGMTA